METSEELIAFDPRGQIEAQRLTLAPRVADLGGLRLGVLDNTKWNAGLLLRRTVERLQQRAPFAAIAFYRKESFSKDADPALLARIATENDIVLTAIGD